jgi:putative ABC transport system permease protein
LKYFHLVRAALLRSKFRTLFTLLAVATAFLLFGLLDSVRGTFAAASASVAGAQRLMTISKVSFTLPLPSSLLPRIQSLHGVAAVTSASWFGGIYRDGRTFFPSQAVADNFFDLYPEWQLSAAERQSFQRIRTGAIVGETLASQFGWKVGDKIPLQATIYPQKDGSNTWIFDLVGIYHTSDPRLRSTEYNFWFNGSYLDEARQTSRGMVGYYIENLSDLKEAQAVAKAIDALSTSSDHETKTQSEQSFTTAFVSQLADVGLIVRSIMGAVFFTLMLLTGNTMAQAVRERTPELAVLKTVGFSDSLVLALVLAESVLLLLAGGTCGMLLAGGAVGLVSKTPGLSLPLLPVAGEAWLRGLALMILIGLFVGALPALRAMRLSIVNALAGR